VFHQCQFVALIVLAREDLVDGLGWKSREILVFSARKTSLETFELTQHTEIPAR
jgi:hypothetical protein